MSGPRSDLARIGAVANLLSGALLLGYWYGYVIFLPYGELTDTLAILVRQPEWTVLNALGALGALVALVGLVGWYVPAMERLGRLGGRGFLVALLGGALLLGPMLWDTILWLPLTRHDESLMRFDGPIYSSALFVPFFITAGLLWSLGYALLGFATYRAKIGSRLAALGVVWGAPLFALGSLAGPYQAVPRTIGMSFLALGLMGIGAGLLRSSEVDAASDS